MKVKDLIEVLQELPQDALVISPAAEIGAHEVNSARIVTVALNVNESAYWKGAHEIIEEYEKEYYKEHVITEAVKIY